MTALNPLENIRVVLVRPFHPGNIGSVARAMKTMGLSDLRLVAPKDYPSLEANTMAAGAEDVLNKAHVHKTLSDAVADCTFIAATSARSRGYDLPLLTPKNAAQSSLKYAHASPVALIFGPERMGLHNEDLKHAKYRIEIAADPSYPSLNLAAAVQIISYEIFQASLKQREPSIDSQNNHTAEPLPTNKDIQQLHEHLEVVLKHIKFLRPHQGETMQRLRHLINHAEPSAQEINILRGILTAIEQRTSSMR